MPWRVVVFWGGDWKHLGVRRGRALLRSAWKGQRAQSKYKKFSLNVRKAVLEKWCSSTGMGCPGTLWGPDLLVLPRFAELTAHLWRCLIQREAGNDS